MPAFKERRDAFEARFAHDEMLNFKAKARTARRAGLWAAQELALPAEQAEALAAGLVEAQVAKGEGAGLFDRIRAEFAQSGLPHSETYIRRRLEAISADAEAETRAGG